MPREIPLTVRFNAQQEQDLNKVKEFFGLPRGLWGENSKAIHLALRFVVEFNELIWEKFQNDFPPLTREYIRKKLVND